MIRWLDYSFSMFCLDEFLSLLQEGRNEPFTLLVDELNPNTNLFRSKQCKIRSQQADEEAIDGSSMSIVIHHVVHPYELHVGLAKKNESNAIREFILARLSANSLHWRQRLPRSFINQT
jgi:hypothetical protein